ncbi:MAG: hypothetical protein JOZ92_05820, partial [Candidatus Dormibacteraeota bacterium]|nr:hypothetical protein [Candidatus Dormibacteraeota bacterium]
MKLRRGSRATATAATEGGAMGPRSWRPRIALLPSQRTDLADLETRASTSGVWSDTAFGKQELHPIDDWEATQAHRLVKPWVLLTRAQKIALAIGATLLVASALRWPLPTALVVNSALIVFFVAANCFKLVLVRRAATHPSALRVSDSDVRQIPDEDLPVYTILLPLYHEAGMIAQMVEGISRLDYPRHRLDIKVLLEEDDHETRAAVLAADLPKYYEVLTVPDAGPRGKPRACNTGLA